MDNKKRYVIRITKVRTPVICRIKKPEKNIGELFEFEEIRKALIDYYSGVIDRLEDMEEGDEESFSSNIGILLSIDESLEKK